MLICGLKLTHDASVAVVRDGRLLFSVEVEKLANNPRYSAIEDLDQVTAILASEGISPGDIDAFALDGWLGDDERSLLKTAVGGRPHELLAAPYHETETADQQGTRRVFKGLRLGDRQTDYASHPHALDHLYSTYCTSPFSQAGEDALVLVWDAGMDPRLYHVTAAGRRVRSLGPLFDLAGGAFAFFALEFGPFKRDVWDLGLEDRVRAHLEVAGKAMAFAGLGIVDRTAFKHFDGFLDAFGHHSTKAAVSLPLRVKKRRERFFPGLSDADLIATYQAYLGDLLLSGLRKRCAELGLSSPNLCLAGGCALNIKWNSAIRDSGVFKAIWVPPFPNDSGAAIGAACAEMIHSTGQGSLTWDVHAGPRLAPSDPEPGWETRFCDEEQLARLLHTTGEPVTVLYGRAETGPRALGNRSILAAAVTPSMKTTLNEIKNRAGYRPVAPICLESRAAEIFDPGGADPYMLFDHVIRPEWVERIPAVRHVDGTARLQTVNGSQNGVVTRVLEAYERLSGVPVLCNTSANLNGYGFFPDAASAMRWGGTRHVWSDGRLHSRVTDTRCP